MQLQSFRWRAHLISDGTIMLRSGASGHPLFCLEELPNVLAPCARRGVDDSENPVSWWSLAFFFEGCWNSLFPGAASRGLSLIISSQSFSWVPSSDASWNRKKCGQEGWRLSTRCALGWKIWAQHLALAFALGYFKHLEIWPWCFGLVIVIGSDWKVECRSFIMLDQHYQKNVDVLEFNLYLAALYSSSTFQYLTTVLYHSTVY